MSNEQTHCPTCNHITAKARRGLSSVLYRQTVGKINSKDDLLEYKDKLIQIFRQKSKKETSQVFIDDLEEKIQENVEVTEIKKWLLEQLKLIGYDNGEKALYRFLYDMHASEGIDKTFTAFYRGYADWVCTWEEPMTKNFVSRALGAIGLKAKMVRIDFEGHKKSAMVFRASAEQIREAIRNSGLVLEE
jgi:hypothetical protein